MLGTIGSPAGVEAISPSFLAAGLTEKTISMVSPAFISPIPCETSTAVKPGRVVCSVFEFSMSCPFLRIHNRTAPWPLPSALPTCAAAITKYAPASLNVMTPLELAIPLTASFWLS